MDKLDNIINTMSDMTKELELSNTELLSDKGVQVNILKNLIEIKYLLKELIKKC